MIKSFKKINVKIVLDPVMVAKGGTKLIQYSAIKYIKNFFNEKNFIDNSNYP